MGLAGEAKLKMKSTLPASKGFVMSRSRRLKRVLACEMAEIVVVACAEVIDSDY